MLAPAVHIMHQVWKGMAWVADGIDEEEVTRSYDIVEQGLSTSDTHSDQLAAKRLSTIVESSCSVIGDKDEISSDFTSGHDVMV
uniref:Transposase n=1 Tax=Panagrolaimus sp. ES5 TaxID=591445 RepID=A0AC34G5W7_9BILA